MALARSRSGAPRCHAGRRAAAPGRPACCPATLAVRASCAPAAEEPARAATQQQLPAVPSRRDALLRFGASAVLLMPGLGLPLEARAEGEAAAEVFAEVAGTSGTITIDAIHVVQALFQAYGKGDVDSMMELVADDVEFSGNHAGGWSVKGKAGVARFLGWQKQVYRLDRYQPVNFFVDGDGDEVTVILNMKGMGKETRLPFETTETQDFLVDRSTGKLRGVRLMVDQAALNPVFGDRLPPGSIIAWKLGLGDACCGGLLAEPEW